ncbi:sensor histidine kinase [Halomonas alkalisoli]|uniref:sensor histidine kinase n=1 Tax=Halomonas alkalisoli TaxID=2907158 RepID=UPI001F314513|nr:HAMP domain-containing sensor histidine kinase [Halomonas alkalisoli]MCE9684329.1 HAMP domain-containing histidine kinase [Halomonas alkalisoli]
MGAAMIRRGPQSIKAMVFMAPTTIIVLMLLVMVVSYQALHQQQRAFLDVVNGPLAYATSTSTRLLIGTSEVQAEVLRYVQLSQRLDPDDEVQRDLRASILLRLDQIEVVFGALRADLERSAEADVVRNIDDFLSIYSAVASRLIAAPEVDSIAVSTVMAHYQQLQSYITELAERSLASAQRSAAATEAQVAQSVYWLVLGSLAIIGAAVLVTLSVGRAITRPITRMIGILSSIAEGRPVAAVPGRERTDEIGAMARAVAVFDRVTRDLRDREGSLVEARRAAEAANATKSAFLANVSHELRTPLTSILGFTRMIRRRLQRSILPKLARTDLEATALGAEIEDYIGIILSEGDRLTTLINNLLDLEKIEAGAMEWEMADTDPADLLARARDATATLHEAAGLRFEIHVTPDVPRVRADRDRIVQVLINLISNAVKFTPAGEIRCEASCFGDDFVEFAVTDTGTGIAPEEQDRIFDKFRQVGDTLTDKPRGTGLGLAISREIVEQHGGQIHVESTPGVGSRFTFTLPRAVARQGDLTEEDKACLARS